MTIAYAVKTLTRNGWTVTRGFRPYTATKAGCRYEISFLPNGPDRPDQDVVCLRVRSLSDHDDIQSDYTAGQYIDSLRRAMRLAEVA